MPDDMSLTRRAVLGAAGAVAVAVPVLQPGRDAAAAPTDTGGTVVKVSSVGHDLLDSTQFLQAALDSDAATVVIDNVPGGWTTGPLFIRRSNLTVIVEPEVMVRSLAGAPFSGLNDCLLTMTDQANVRISGYGATFAMNKPEYKTGEWRMALKINGCSNVVVEGLTLRDSGGDGVYLGAGPVNPHNTDIVLRDLVCDNNRRQGLSVISADRLTVEGCAFLNTNGTAPQSGIDFEPNAATQKLVDIVVRDCWLDGNTTAGIQLYGGQLRPTSTPVSISVERTTVGHQIGGSPQVMISTGKSVFPGTFELRDSLIDVGSGSSAFGVLATGPNGVLTKVTRTVMWDWGNAFQVYHPIEVLSRGVNEYGNLAFTDAVLHSDQPGPFLHADALPGTTVHKVSGTITAVGPVGAAELGPDPQQSDVRATIRSSVPTATVSVRVDRGVVSGGQGANLIFTRSGDAALALAVAYRTCGGARERYDYGGLGKVAVFAPGAREVRVPVRTFARRRAADPRRRDLVVSVANGHGYQPQPVTATLRIQD